MNKENIMENLLSIGMLVIILTWFLIVHKLFTNMDTLREQCGKNMNDLSTITVTYDTKITDLKSTINKQQNIINQLEERMDTLETENAKLKKSIDNMPVYVPTVEEE